MRSLAIIPARGGSKRVPGKNLAEVGGRSLVERALDAAWGAGCVAVVSSDDEQILTHARPQYAEEAGVEYYEHRRLPEHATDSAQLEPVIDDVLASIDRVGAETHGIGIDAIVLLQPTSPFRTAAHVAEALRILRETGCDSVVSVTRLHSLWGAFNGSLSTRSSGGVWTHDPDGDHYRRADYDDLTDEALPRVPSSSLGHLAYENGAVYAFTRRHWNATHSRMGGDMRALVMHWSEAVEVDTPEDLAAARRMAR